MAEQIERELGWEEEVKGGGDFTLLPEGEYNYRITHFTKARFNGSTKLPACWQAKVNVEVLDDDGNKLTTIEHNLFLHTKCQGLLCDFFKGIGVRKHGETVKMDWSSVAGATGRCKVGIRKWQGKDKMMENNEIKKFIEPSATEEVAF